NQQFRD
ncbi:hypothetical protein EC950183_2987, partial [Escherichia coli 95.0183]